MSTIDERAEEDEEAAEVDEVSFKYPVTIPSVPLPQNENNFRETFVLNDKTVDLGKIRQQEEEPVLAMQAETFFVTAPLPHKHEAGCVKDAPVEVPEAKPEVKQAYFLTAEDCDYLAAAEVQPPPLPPKGRNINSIMNQRRILQQLQQKKKLSVSRPSESEFSVSKLIPCSTPLTRPTRSSSASSGSSGAKTKPSVVEKFNGAATAAAINPVNTTATKKAARRSVTGKAMLNRTSSSKPKLANQRLTLIKPMRGGAGGMVASHPNPFASRNIYYDERWVQKQETGFKKWLNFILTPDSLDDNEDNALAPGKIDVAKLWKACSSNVRVPRAPTREVFYKNFFIQSNIHPRLICDVANLWRITDEKEH
jgi:hypothetical protein